MADILVFKETVLPRSETFILAQMGALKSFSSRMIGLEPVEGGLQLPSQPLLLSQRAGSAAVARARLYRRVGIAPRFHAEARRERPRLIHAHFATGGRTALPLARRLRIPLLVTLHGSDVTVPWARPSLIRHLGQAAARFLCVSQFIRDRAVAAGLPEAKLVVHHIGIHRSQFPPPPAETPRRGVLFVGRLVEKKGCVYLVRAMERVQRDRPDAVLTVIGEGPLLPQVQALATELKLSCRFLGAQGSDIVRTEMSRASVLCVPSVTASDGDSEGLPTVLAEAQAVGLPTVGTMHAGIPEIIRHGETGLLVAERDHEGLAVALSSLLSSQSMQQTIRENASRQLAESFDLHKQTEHLEDIYRDVISQHTARSR
jgi:glycosyltransferase involved in cell wall biosynthesis